MTSQERATPSPQQNILYVINKLYLKAFESKSLEQLGFVMLNDTIRAIRYDRALLWDMEGVHPRLLGISGQTKVNRHAQTTLRWNHLVRQIENPSEPQILDTELFFTETAETIEGVSPETTSIMWLPIHIDGKLSVGLWIEDWHKRDKGPQPEEVMKFLMETLIPGYAISWERLSPKFSLKKMYHITKEQTYTILLVLFVILLVVRIPLRIVAPCEVVPADPILVTAPLEGIIEEIVVEPGETVKEGTVLFEYDKRVPIQQLKVAEKEVQITQSEINRAITLGVKDKKSLVELATKKLKLEKEKLDYDFTKYQVSQLTVKAPADGVVMVQNPDGWRGKPVKVGERVMTVNDPLKTQVKIWIPQDDNIILNRDESIKIFLNINPERSHLARVIYIEEFTTISEKQIPSFIAEAEWVEAPERLKLGLKGTAILYGEKVSLFYFVMRKPWIFLRNLIGF